MMREADQENKWFFDSEEALDQWIFRFLQDRSSETPTIFLDSQQRGHPASSFSYIAADPVCWIRSRDGETTTGSSGDSIGGTGTVVRTGPAWDMLKTFREEYPDWMFGWLGYDLKNDDEDLQSSNHDPLRLPDLFFFVPALLLRISRTGRCVEAIKGDLPVPSVTCQPDRSSTARKTGFEMGELISMDGWSLYRNNVEKIRRHIAAGDTYEVNLTHMLHAEWSGDPLILFRAMKREGPVPFAAWLAYGDIRVCCASPERFLQRSGDLIRSQPIKGTSPRGSDPESDRRIVRDILRMEKNKAENVMIVDLVRHDMSRVAKIGSVRTDALLEVQSFSTLHQLVSTVSARVADGFVSTDVIRACFPMGSMTGAPKIRTLGIIEELESYRRGLYSGAIGYFRPNDDFDFNVVIRTAIVNRDKLYYPVGGAITADSSPEDEWQETWLKAGLLQRIQATAI